MIDLSYKPRKQPKRTEPEEIICGIVAAALWIGIIFGIMAGC